MFRAGSAHSSALWHWGGELQASASAEQTSTESRQLLAPTMSKSRTSSGTFGHSRRQSRADLRESAGSPSQTVTGVPLIRHELATPGSVQGTASLESAGGKEQLSAAHLMPPHAQVYHKQKQALDTSVYSTSSDHVTSRWQESVPLTADGAAAGDLDDAHTIVTQTDKEEDPDEPTTIRGKIAKFVKILVPHVVLISMLLGYLSLGAVVLTKMESGLETDKRRSKMDRLLNMHDEIANETWRIQQLPEINYTFWNDTLRDYFLRLAEVHDGPRFKQQFKLYPHIDSKWTFPTALLYALTVLTTCGYGEVGVYTAGGQLFAVAFALVGIPLMFITAADIGKFLSESLMKMVDVSKTCYEKFTKCIQRIKSGKPEVEDEEGEEDDEFYGAPPEQLEKLWFPIITYVSVISGYCAMGAVMFRTWEPTWEFIHAFHFGFNLIVTVGLGEIVVTDPIFLCLIVAFVIVGLSVVTMCVDLASTHLKAYFTRIHYFGRAKKFLDMSDDIRNMVEYLAWMRKKKGGQVTWQDVRDLMESIRLGPYNPREAAKWRWIDESSSAMSTFRHNSMQSDLTKHSFDRGYSFLRHSKDLSPFAEEDYPLSRSARSSRRSTLRGSRSDLARSRVGSKASHLRRESHGHHSRRESHHLGAHSRRSSHASPHSRRESHVSPHSRRESHVSHNISDGVSPQML